MGSLKPRRLERRGGAWALTVETLVSVAPDLFVPTRYEVEGVEPIAATLAQMGETERLGQQARRIFEQFSPESANEAAFEPRDGTWLPVAPEPALVATQEEIPVETAEILQRIEQRLWLLEQRFQRVTELEKRVARLLNLERRIAKIEGALENGVVPAADLAAGDPAAEPSPGDPVAGIESAEIEALRADAESPPSGEDGADADADAASAEDGDEPDADESGEAAEGDGEDPADAGPKPARPVLGLPEAEPIEETLQMLVGDTDVVLTEDETLPSLKPREIKGWQVSWLKDDGGEVLGAIVTDVKATVVLGGSLLMVPERVQQEHIRSRRPSEEEVEAISEVFNNLAPAFNNVEGNRHVRAANAERLQITSDSWLHEPHAFRSFETPFGGRILLYARPGE